MVQAQQWLESQTKYNTKAKREQITRLDIIWKELEGSLDLTDFVNLERLECHHNQLTSLNLSKSVNLTKLGCYWNNLTQLILPTPNNLEWLFCWGNLLTDLNWSALNGETLTFLILENNNFSPQDLNCLANLTQLKKLCLGTNDEERINQGTYNRWIGSLKPLKNLTKLKELNIINTDINGGHEYLPDSLKWIWCSGNLAELLMGYQKNEEDDDSYDYQTWRKDNQELIITVKMLNNLSEALLGQILNELTDKALQIFIFQTRSKIIELEKQSKQLKLEVKVEIPPKN